LPLLWLLSACPAPGPISLGNTDLPDGAPQSCVQDSGMIVATPASFSSWRAGGFDRYTEVVAPNGKPIRIFVGSDVPDSMALRARNILDWFLADVPGSEHGADKSAVANSMADNDAVLMLPGGAHEEGNEPPFDAQPLYFAEMTPEGGDWYQSNDWDHRDASFEEIFHLVHDSGIGTYLPGALPDYQTALEAEADAALADGRWGIPVEPDIADWIAELAAEGSLAQEYIASVIDSYYGYWGAWDEAEGGMWGVYIAKTRAEIAMADPAGGALLEAFLPTSVGYEARLDPNFAGTFSMAFDPAAPYTHKSQYLLQVTLTGSEPSAITGNSADNLLRGNSADNTLDGGAGEDTAIYCGNQADYSFTASGDDLIVDGPDGRDLLRSIEQLHFLDGVVAAPQL
jgi:hypothetical protein